MGNIDIILEVVLVGLLAITLVHAMRLERALHALRHDRAALGDAIAGFDSSTREAEVGISRMQLTTADSTKLLGQRIEQGASLKDDLKFLIDRGEAAADRLDAVVRSTRAAASSAPPPATAAAEPLPKVRSQAERDLLLALRGAQ